MTSLAVDPNVLRSIGGFLVADARGRVVGRVERADHELARLTVRRGFPFRRRRIVAVSVIEEIDTTSGVIALRVERETLPTV